MRLRATSASAFSTSKATSAVSFADERDEEQSHVVSKAQSQARASSRTLSRAESEEFAQAEIPTAFPPLRRSVSAFSETRKSAKVPTCKADTQHPEETPEQLRQEQEDADQPAVDHVKAKDDAQEQEQEQEIEAAPTLNGRVPGPPIKKPAVGPQDFELLCVIGQGAFGKVIQVRHKPTDEILAMKIVSTKYIVERNSVPYLQAERDIMTRIRHPFLINLRYAFQTPRNVYLVMPYVAGGELFHHLCNEGILLEDAARFYAAEMVLALEHLHSLGIIHRDLKPENILLDTDGHIRLTDFGLAKEMTGEDDSTKTVCGTNEYMAPEMVRGKAYNQAVDWWALGALLYEMLTGKPPFCHKNKKKLLQKITNEKLFLPKWLTADSHSILKQLLERNVDKRLGSGKSTMFKVRGVQAIKQHSFFRDIDWHLLMQRKLEPPIIPKVESSTDTSNFESFFTKLAVGKPSGAEPDPAASRGVHDDSPPHSPGGRKLFDRFSFDANEFPPLS